MSDDGEYKKRTASNIRIGIRIRSGKSIKYVGIR